MVEGRRCVESSSITTQSSIVEKGRDHMHRCNKSIQLNLQHMMILDSKEKQQGQCEEEVMDRNSVEFMLMDKRRDFNINIH